VKQITVCGVYLECIEAQTSRALCCLYEKPSDSGEPISVQRRRRRFAFLLRHGGWTEG